ncbi:MAG: AAC(3) family N-acetyltransferase [Promethearchaeota archaeon]
MIIENLKLLFEEYGIKKGDIICIHSDITSFGIPKELKDKVKEKGINFLLESYIDTFKAVVSENGLILMPTYTYSATKNEVFHIQNTPSTVGALTEYFRKQKSVHRSLHPIFSYAAWGKNAEDFLKIDNFDCFGENSIFEKFFRLNIKYVLFGVDMQHGATFVYYSEEKAKVYYRYHKIFKGRIKDDDGSINKVVNVKYFVRNYDIPYEDYWYDLEKIALERYIAKKFEYSGGNILIMKSQEIDALIQEELSKNKDFLIKRLKV